jgi:hypothetical protein
VLELEYDDDLRFRQDCLGLGSAFGQSMRCVFCLEAEGVLVKRKAVHVLHDSSHCAFSYQVGSKFVNWPRLSPDGDPLDAVP